MCNLYSLTKGQDAIREMFGVRPGNDRTGNLPLMPGVYPDYAAPIIRAGADGREMLMARWGMPTPPEHLINKKTGLPKTADPGVTNIRNFHFRHWQPYMGVESRCVVPFTSFSENENYRMARSRPFGSRWTRHGRWPASPVSAPVGPPSARPRRGR